MLMLVDHTRRRTVVSRDAIWIGHLWLLWVIWGHVVTLTRLTDSEPFSRSPTDPRADRLASDPNAAAG